MMDDTLITLLGYQSLYVTVAAVAIYALIKLLRVRDPRILLTLWALVLLRFFLPLDLATPWSARAQFHTVATHWVGTSATLRAQAQKGQRAAQTSAVQDVVTRVWLPPHSAAAPQQAKLSGASFPWRKSLFLLWLTGAFTLAGLALRQHLQLLALLRRSTPVTSAQISRQIDIWRARYGIRRAVTVLAGDTPMSPFTFGLRQPVIYVPAVLLESLTPAERDAVFGHELAHVQGLDILWLIAERAVQITFFFHPVAWLATRQLARAREGCCDLRAVQAGDMSHGSYWSGVLLALRQSHVDAPALAFAPALGPSAQSLKERIVAMKQARPMTKVKWIGVACGTALLALLILPMARSQQVVAQSAASNAVASKHAGKPVAPIAAPMPPAPPSAPQAANVQVSVDADVAQAQQEAELQIQAATQRLAAAQESVRRISTGDFGNMIIVHNDKEVICPPGTSQEDIKCTRSFRPSDVETLRHDAAQELADASRDLEEARRDSAQSVIDIRTEAEQNAKDAAEEARTDAEVAREDARAAAEEAQRAMADANQAQRDASQRIAEAHANAREIEIEALQDTLTGLREAARRLRDDHRGDRLASQTAQTGQVIANVVQSLEASARQVEQQLAEARTRNR
jgi:beta-lactamase regulating signal transducer with metallopeptidase domain